MGRPKEHGAQTRAALLSAAAEILHAEGAAAVSVRRVAAAVGTTTRAVYSLFDDKDGLLRALSVDVAETMRRHHEAVPSQADPIAEIVELALAYRAAALEKPKLYDLFFGTVRAGATQADPLFALVYRSFERVLSVVRRAVADGVFAGRAEFDVGRGLFALVHGLASLELRGVLGGEAEAVAIWRQSVGAMLTGLREPPA
ncbi:TetR/AcrR family transcriptional regulator [Actinoplanes sp. CA-030573]|uniref:TetR/AcrR family transcriptional regulator n=1 Tax=Actinoplanes sp. CA-030573 TaxID=3239898 RepID=UPI003D8E7BD2